MILHPLSNCEKAQSNFYLFIFSTDRRAAKVADNMKATNKPATVNVNVVRKAIKAGKTPCAQVKALYIFMQSSEDENAKLLTKIFPKDKQKVIDALPVICEMYKVGQTRKNGTIIRFSVDMAIRAYTKAANETIKNNYKQSKLEEAVKAKAEKEAKKAAEAAAKAEQKRLREEERAQKKAEQEKAKSAAKAKAA